MASFTGSTPPITQYEKYDSRVYFSYRPGNTTFQTGYLGVRGSKVSGILHVRFPIAVPTKNIILQFVGREVVEWGAELSRHRRSEKIIFNKSMYLWQSKTEIGHELISDLDLPFEFTLPNDAVESFNSSLGGVVYTFEAIINRKPKKKKTTSILRVPINKWCIPDEFELRPLVIKSKDERRKVPISWKSSFPQTFFDIGRDALVKLQLTSHDPSLKIRKVSACLRTCLYYKLEDHNITIQRSEQHSKYTVQGKELPFKYSGSDVIYDANIVINIPKDIPPTCKTKCITVKNKVMLKISFEHSRHHVLIMREIIVGRNYTDDRPTGPIRELLDMPPVIPSSK